MVKNKEFFIFYNFSFLYIHQDYIILIIFLN
jgi:hypothetical protein